MRRRFFPRWLAHRIKVWRPVPTRSIWTAWGFGLCLVVLGALAIHESVSLVALGVELVGAGIVTLLVESRLPLLHVGEEPALPISPLIASIKNDAEDRVRILDIWMGSLVGHDATYEKLRSAIKAAVARGTTVEILILDPNTEQAKDRASALRQDHEKFLACSTRLELLKEELAGASSGDKFQVRLLNTPPEVALHQVDDRAYWSFYPPHSRSATNPRMRVDTGHAVGRYLGRQFDNLWNATTTTPLPRSTQAVVVEQGS